MNSKVLLNNHKQVPFSAPRFAIDTETWIFLNICEFKTATVFECLKAALSNQSFFCLQ